MVWNANCIKQFSIITQIKRRYIHSNFTLKFFNWAINLSDVIVLIQSMLTWIEIVLK